MDFLIIYFLAFSTRRVDRLGGGLVLECIYILNLCPSVNRNTVKGNCARTTASSTTTGKLPTTWATATTRARSSPTKYTRGCVSVRWGMSVVVNVFVPKMMVLRVRDESNLEIWLVTIWFLVCCKAANLWNYVVCPCVCESVCPPYIFSTRSNHLTSDVCVWTSWQVGPLIQLFV